MQNGPRPRRLRRVRSLLPVAIVLLSTAASCTKPSGPDRDRGPAFTGYYQAQDGTEIELLAQVGQARVVTAGQSAPDLVRAGNVYMSMVTRTPDRGVFRAQVVTVKSEVFLGQTLRTIDWDDATVTMDGDDLTVVLDSKPVIAGHQSWTRVPAPSSGSRLGTGGGLP